MAWTSCMVFSASPARGIRQSIATLALFAPAATGQDLPPHPEEVFLSDLVFSQDRSELQVTAAPSVEDWNDRRALATSLGLEYGLTDAWQVELGWRTQPLAVERTHELEIGTRYSWLDIGGSRLHAAVGAEAEWEGTAFDALSPYLVVARSLGPVHAFATGVWAVGLNDEGTDGADETARRWGLAGGAVLPAGPVFLTIEADWSHPGGSNRLTAAPGVVVPLTEAWQVGIGLPVSHVEGSTSVGLAAFASFEAELGGGDGSPPFSPGRSR